MAYDKHTPEGQKLGRGFKHFFEEGAKLENMGNVPDPYAERAKQLLIESESFPVQTGRGANHNQTEEKTMTTELKHLASDQDTSHDLRLEHLDRSVEELELSVRSCNCLKNSDIQTIRELVQKSEDEMLRIRNFGHKSLNEIRESLVRTGLSLGMKFDEHGRIISGRQHHDESDYLPHRFGTLSPGKARDELQFV